MKIPENKPAFLIIESAVSWMEKYPSFKIGLDEDTVNKPIKINAHEIKSIALSK